MCVYVVENKTVTLRVKHIEIPVCFLQEQFYNGIFVPKYQKPSVITGYMCTKPFSGPVIIRSTKMMTGFILYPSSDTENYQIVILQEFFVN